jgi:hypothetical protein
MSDFIQPTLQNPTPCDFGPFAGGYCGKVVTIDFRQATSQISIGDLEVELFENATANISLRDLVVSAMPINWIKTEFFGVTGGEISFNPALAELVFTPDQTPSIDRTVEFTYKVFDEFDYEAEGKIIINIIDKTPELTVGNFTLNGTESQIFDIDIKSKVVTKNTEVDYSLIDSVQVTQILSEGSVTISDGIITFTPSEEPANNRTVTFKYIVKDITGIEAEGTIAITLQDTTPALTVNNFSKNVLDSATLTASILSNIVIKNDTFKSLTFETITDGTITSTGSNYTYLPDKTLKTDRTIVINYTVETQSGISKTAQMTVVIKHDNIWAGTFWYGNSEKEDLLKEDIELLSFAKKTGYAGTYSVSAASGAYKWFVYPKVWGENPTILDASNNMPIATDDNRFITVEGIDLVAIRTYYQLNGAITVKFS